MEVLILKKHEVIRAAMLELGFPYDEADQETSSAYKVGDNYYMMMINDMLQNENYGINIDAVSYTHLTLPTIA